MNEEIISEEIYKQVKKSLPEVEMIEDEKLRDRVCAGWAFALQKNGFTALEELEHSGTPGIHVSKNKTQADHIRGVTRIAIAIAKELDTQFEQFCVDFDELIAGALCHDIGKPFEYNSSNRKRWKENPMECGSPSIRHSVYGVYVTLSVGLPEKIAHVAGAHSKEGQFVERSLVAEIIHFADEAYWNILAKAQIVKV